MNDRDAKQNLMGLLITEHFCFDLNSWLSSYEKGMNNKFATVTTLSKWIWQPWPVETFPITHLSKLGHAKMRGSSCTTARNCKSVGVALQIGKLTPRGWKIKGQGYFRAQFRLKD
jgi:hypothetical protein